MGQILHGSATTTHAIRTAIQRSRASIQALSKRYGVNPKTVMKWKKRDFVEDAPMGPKEMCSTVLSKEEEALIVAFRRHTLLSLDDCLYALQATIPYLDRSTLHRLFQRHGISRLPDVERAKPRKKFKTYPIGYFHIDIARVWTEEGKLHMFIATDRVSKFAYAQLHKHATRGIAADFLRKLIEIVPYKIHTVLTDNERILLYPEAAAGTSRRSKGCLSARRSSGITLSIWPVRKTTSIIASQNPTILGLTAKLRGWDEPHDQGGHCSPLLLRQPRKATGPSRHLSRCVQLR